MKKLIPFSLALLLIVYANALSAHAVVTDYSLKIKPIHPNQKDTIELTFNSQVELDLSQVFLVRKGDIHEPLAIRKGERQGQMIVEIPPLGPGDYAIKFKVFAADGHLTEDVIHFSVSQ